MSEELVALGEEAAGCTRCRLAQGRTQVVFGSGDPKAAVMFVGEGPGFHEDRLGLPFVGPSGKLLERLLAGIGLGREDVYICNVVKCRPPGNRDPLPDEIVACRPYLEAQVRIVDPKIVVTLGNFAARTLLDTTTGITRLRGRPYPFQGRRLLATFHPAAALRGGTGRSGSGPLEGLEADFELLGRLLREPAPVAAPTVGQDVVGAIAGAALARPGSPGEAGPLSGGMVQGALLAEAVQDVLAEDEPLDVQPAVTPAAGPGGELDAEPATGQLGLF